MQRTRTSISTRNASVSRLSRRPTSSLSRTVQPRRRAQSVASVSRPVIEKKAVQAPMASISNNIIHTRQKLTSFGELNIPKSTKTLSVEHNEIKDFRGFPPLPELERLDASDNPIDSLYGFPSFPNLKSINLKNTPFGNTEFARISLIMICGKALRTINGETIKPSEVRVAKQYPADCVNLLKAGWIMTYPPPSQSDIVNLKRKLSKNMISSRPKKDSTQPRILSRPSKKQSAIYSSKIELQDREIQRLSNEIEKLQGKRRYR